MAREIGISLCTVTVLSHSSVDRVMIRYTSLPSRTLVHLAGRDTFKYLQAITTNNLATPRSQFTAFLNAQGRVLYDAFIYKTADDACLVEVDSSSLQSFIAHLKRYKLRSKFTIREVGDELSVHSIWDTPQATLPESVHLEPDQRSPAFGHRLLCPSDSLSSLNLGAELKQESIEAYTRRRYQNGIGEGPKELLPEKALPMESNIDYMNGLDFHKGCYLGQELTVRTHHTGVIRKRLMPVQLCPENAPMDERIWTAGVDDKIDILRGEGAKRPAGRLLARVGDLGLALCRLEKMTAGQQGLVTIGEQQYKATAMIPEHWPGNAQSV